MRHMGDMDKVLALPYVVLCMLCDEWKELEKDDATRDFITHRAAKDTDEVRKMY